jgi:hypothetical protein
MSNYFLKVREDKGSYFINYNIPFIDEGGKPRKSHVVLRFGMLAIRLAEITSHLNSQGHNYVIQLSPRNFSAEQIGELEKALSMAFERQGVFSR